MKFLPPLRPLDVQRPLPPFDPPRTVHRPKALALGFSLLGIAVAGCSAGGWTPSQTVHAPSAERGIGNGRYGANIARALPAVSPSPVPAAQVACNPGPPAPPAPAAPGAPPPPPPAPNTSCGVQVAPVPPSNTPSSGMTLAQLRAAYGLPAASGAPSATSPIVAVVDAYDDPQAEADLGKYRAQFGLAPCTTPNGCFKKVNLPPTPGQPPAGAGPAGAAATATWDDEITLDLAMASAACPTCRIVLVEAGGQDLDSLASAVNTAATYGPAAIGASWGVPEYGNLSGIDSTAQAAFNHPGVAIAVSAGDAGLGSVQFPASSPYVTSVGGTTLTPDASSPRGYDESVWSQSGNGCSGMYGAPGWQTITNGCAGRAVPDISVLANYSPGIAVYSTADKGWVVMGGTSAGAPFIAGLYAAAGGAPASGAGAIYANASALNVVAGGSGRLLSPNGLTGF